MAKPTFVFVVGTRPDAIKTAPVVREFRKFSDQVDTFLLSTGQHREMLSQALAAFGLQADRDLEVMRHGQSLAELTARILTGIDGVLSEVKPAAVFAQGDTTTTFVAGLAAFYRQIPYAHVEAGLRTPDIHNPFPEEFNRRTVSLFARWHFPPTKLSAEHLIREGIDPDQIVITGNTGIDAVMQVAESTERKWYADHAGRIVLLTTHRRENWGEPQRNIASAARELIDQFPDIRLVVPMHRNPDVRATLQSILGDSDRVDLIEPPDYADFVKLMERSDLILTDSGGVQEEAPSFGVPVLILRTTTERPEGLDAGVAQLVGTDREAVLDAAIRHLNNAATLERRTSPYGDGRASERIRYAVLQSLGIDSPAVEPWG